LIVWKTVVMMVLYKQENHEYARKLREVFEEMNEKGRK
tara:strand:- start:874 stop:987 length:114 start_codon:yes stop_codon:yes gene_type:complete